MKSVVVIDTPETCKECLFNGFNWNVCILTDEDIDEYVNPNETKPDWCPLKPLPQKMPRNELGNMSLYKSGWNACIDEIVGEQNESRMDK